MVQPICAERRLGERREMQRDERVRTGAEPGPVAHADEHERSDPGCDQAGEHDQRQRGAAEARGLDHEDRRHERRAEDGRDRGEGAGRPHDHEHLGRRVPLGQLHREQGHAPAQRDERGFRPEHEPETDRRQRRQHDARQHVRLGRPHLETVRGDVATVPGKAHDGERDGEAGEEEHGKRPPPRNTVEPEVARQIVEHADLDLVDQLEESPRRERHDDADDRGEHEDHDEALGPEQRHRIRRSRRIRWSGRSRRRRQPSGITSKPDRGCARHSLVGPRPTGPRRASTLRETARLIAFRLPRRREDAAR